MTTCAVTTIRPRGARYRHPRVDLLKRKGLIVSFRPIPGRLLPSRKLVDWLAGDVRATAPLVEWLAFAVS